MHTIAIVNEKGGTGKTTTAVNLSAALGEMGRRVLLVDLDGQAASSRWLGVEDDTSFADALWSGENLRPIPDVVPGVSLAPGSGKLDSVAHDLRPTQGGQLRKLLAGVEGFEYVVIDCPPSLGNRLIGNALLAATHAIVPVETSVLALDGLRILLTTIEDVREGFGHEIELAGVVACRYDSRTKLSRFILAELKRALPDKVFETVIRENVRVRECPGSGQSILQYAPDSHAAEDYRSLAREVAAMFEQAPAEDGAAASEGAAQSWAGMAQMRKHMDEMIARLGGPAEIASDPAAVSSVEAIAAAEELPGSGVREPLVEPSLEPSEQRSTQEPSVEPPAETAGDAGEPIDLTLEAPVPSEPKAGDAPRARSRTEEDLLRQLEAFGAEPDKSQEQSDEEPDTDENGWQVGHSGPKERNSWAVPVQEAQQEDAEDPWTVEEPSTAASQTPAGHRGAGWEVTPTDGKDPVMPDPPLRVAARDEGDILGLPDPQETEPAVEEPVLSQEPPALVEAEQPADGTEESASDGDNQDYPALRAMLERMGGGSKAARSPGDSGGAEHGWRKILNKVTGGS